MESSMPVFRIKARRYQQRPIVLQYASKNIKKLLVIYYTIDTNHSTILETKSNDTNDFIVLNFMIKTLMTKYFKCLYKTYCLSNRTIYMISLSHLRYVIIMYLKNFS